MFKTGDVVCLKSGGPRMTVQNYMAGSVICTWFDGSSPKHLAFRAEMLMVEPVESEAPAIVDPNNYPHHRGE